MMPMRSGSDAELLRARADDADRTLRVAELDRMVISRSEAVLQHERADAHRVEERGDLTSLVVHRQVRVAAARATTTRGAGGRGGWRG